MNSVAFLDRLVAFPSITRTSNRKIACFIADELRRYGIEVEELGSGDKVNLFATLGAKHKGGVILSGHMDVVPAEGQAWSSDPFRLSERDGRLYGRGTADMKGFLACLMAFAARVPRDRLKRPIHLCFSHDEEIGCVGVRPMLAMLAKRELTAEACIVGEPTGMGVVIGHKGKLAATMTCLGVAGHSSRAPEALNAIHLAADAIAVLRERQAHLQAHGSRDDAYDIPYSTIHAGLIRGGTALNIVPDRCVVDFEIRTVAADSAPDLLANMATRIAELEAKARQAFDQAAIEIDTVNAYPGLDTDPHSGVVRFTTSLAQCGEISKVAFGTEGGLFAATLKVPTIVCGPGSMDQGHKADEFITREQLDRCDAMLDRLAARLSG